MVSVANGTASFREQKTVACQSARQTSGINVDAMLRPFHCAAALLAQYYYRHCVALRMGLGLFSSTLIECGRRNVVWYARGNREVENQAFLIFNMPSPLTTRTGPSYNLVCLYSLYPSRTCISRP